MSVARRVVFDTSTLIGAALRAGPKPRQALDHALANCDVVVSVDLLEELEKVLARSKFDAYVSRNTRRDFISLLRSRVQVLGLQAADMEVVHGVCRDPKDAHVLALGLVSRASVIVSSDNDLLVLHPWNGIAILKPAEFLADVGQSTGSRFLDL